MQTFRAIILGKSGSGKTVLAKKMFQRMAGRYSRLIILNRKPDWAEYCDGRYIVRSNNADPEYALKRHKSVFFRVTGLESRDFLNRLGYEILRHRNTLLIADEGHNFFGQHDLAHGMVLVLVEGRELGVNSIIISQQLRSSLGAIHRAALRQATHLISFRLSESNEIKAFSEICPEWGPRVAQLRRPVPEDPGAPEYVIKSLDSERAGVVLRDPVNPNRQTFSLLSY